MGLSSLSKEHDLGKIKPWMHESLQQWESRGHRLCAWSYFMPRRAAAGGSIVTGSQLQVWALAAGARGALCCPLQSRFLNVSSQSPKWSRSCPFLFPRTEQSVFHFWPTHQPYIRLSRGQGLPQDPAWTIARSWICLRKYSSWRHPLLPERTQTEDSDSATGHSPLFRKTKEGIRNHF